MITGFENSLTMIKKIPILLILTGFTGCAVFGQAQNSKTSQPANTPMNDRWNLNLLNTAVNADYLTQVEKDVILEVNEFRSNPSRYAELYILPYRQYYKGNKLEIPGRITIITQEGIRALNNCLSELKKSHAAPLLYPAKGLCRAAEDHAKDQGRTGKVGHTGSDGSTMADRVSRYGKWLKTIGENIDYGNSTAREIVISLLIDDGVPSRGHRKNLLNDTFNKIGVAVGPHPIYGYVCVIDFAGDYQ